MKSPSDAQNTSTIPTTLSNSILQALSSGSLVENSVLPIPVTHTSPESTEVQRERLRMIINLAIAMIEDSGDFDPLESSKADPHPPQ
jgi:hypothetical protein